MGQVQPVPRHAPPAPWGTVPRFRAISPTLAWVLGCVVLVLAVAAIALTALIGQLSIGIPAGVVVVLTFAAVGLLIARRQSANPIGWIMVVFTLLYVLGAAASDYAVLCYRLGHRGLPLAPLALLLSAVETPSFAMFPLVILLFPDGRVPGRRWRWAARAYAGLVAFVLALFLAAPAAALADHDVRLNRVGNLTSSDHLSEWLANPPGWLIVPVIAAIVIIGLSLSGTRCSAGG